MSDAKTPTDDADRAATAAPEARPLTLDVLAVLLAALPALFATGFTSYEGFRRYGLAAGVSVALLSWGVDVARRRRLRVFAARPLMLWLTLGLLALCSALWSVNPLYALSQSTLWVSLAALGALVLGVRANASQLVHALLPAVGVGTSLAGVMGLLDRAGARVFTIVWDPTGATGAFDAMEFAAAYYVIALPLCLGGVAGLRARVARALCAAGLLLGALHLGMVWQDWALIALGVGVGVASILVGWPGEVRGRRLGGALGAVALMGCLVGVGASFKDQRATAAPESTSLPVIDAVDRKITLETKLAMAPRNPRFALDRVESFEDPDARDHLRQTTQTLAGLKPPLGLGAGGWWLAQAPAMATPHAFTVRQFDHYPAFKSPHHGFGLVWVELGLLGLVLFAGWILAALMLGARGILALDAADEFEREDARLILWGAFGAGLAGVLAMWWSAALELPEAAAIWIVALTLGLRLSALSGEVRAKTRGWRHPWTLDDTQRGATAMVAALSIATSVALLIPTGLDAASAYHRGVADQLMLRSSYEKARAAYLRAHSIYPSRGQDLFNAALASYRLGELKTGMRQELEQAQLLAPSDARIMVLSSLLAMRQRRFKDAIEGAREAILRHPAFLEAYRILASAQSLSFEPQEAAQTLHKALALNPPLVARGPLHYELAQLYEGPLGKAALAVEQYDLAIKHLDQGFIRDRSVQQAKELRRRQEVERLQREGKPIPPELMPASDGHDHGHGHGDGHDHGHSHGPGQGILPDSEVIRMMMEKRQRDMKGEPSSPQAPAPASP